MTNDILESLEKDGLLPPGTGTLHAFGGGVSSDVWRVDSPGRPSFVVKRSVPKLRVQADWFSDPARLRYEFLYLQTVADILPDAVPRLLTSDPSAPYLAMEFLGEGFENWKSLLLAGKCITTDATRAGSILGAIHAATRNNPRIPQIFDTLEFFTQLRIDAYLRFTAERHPGPVGQAILDEAERLGGHNECLIHGDFSPKNMLSGTSRFVILDCETACYGDPAFDLAFLLNHLCLKALYHSPSDCELPTLAGAAWTAYQSADPLHAPTVASRAAILLSMLLLARVDGKSPVEYLSPEKQAIVRQFACHQITQPNLSLQDVLGAWFAHVAASPTRSIPVAEQ
ncbi:MAG: aminoglycoside phosphotransferase family protein [Terrimicrobiaceae bacterium]